MTTLPRNATPSQLRAYIVARYQPILTHGGCATTYFRAVRLCTLLARMTKSTAEQVVADVRSA